eukprot:3785696-Amphidinium_carterae.1
MWHEPAKNLRCLGQWHTPDSRCYLLARQLRTAFHAFNGSSSDQPWSTTHLVTVVLWCVSQASGSLAFPGTRRGKNTSRLLSAPTSLMFQSGVRRWLWLILWELLGVCSWAPFASYAVAMWGGGAELSSETPAVRVLAGATYRLPSAPGHVRHPFLGHGSLVSASHVQTQMLYAIANTAECAIDTYAVILELRSRSLTMMLDAYAADNAVVR